MRPFEGVKVLDCTHVLAGPFTAYQLAVLGADVIKVEDPNEPDQSDYATGTMGAFAVSAALYQTMRTGKGQHIDMAMLDVALILQSSHITDYYHTGKHQKRAGNRMRFPESSMHEASDGLLQLAASNRRQHRRFYNAIGEAAEAERTSLDERNARYDEKHAAIAAKLKQKTAQEWEDYLQAKHVPATRVRETHETLKDEQLKHRRVLHTHGKVPGVNKPVTVPLAAFKFAHDGPSIERPPARLGEHTDSVLAAVGYSAAEIAALRKAKAVA